MERPKSKLSRLGLKKQKKLDLYKVSNGTALVLYGIAVPFSLLFMAFALAAGLSELAKAFVAFEWVWDTHSTAVEEGKSISLIVKALELFILAPLPFFVLQGVARYLTLRVSENTSEPAVEEAAFLRVKATLASILASALAVDLVREMLQPIGPGWQSLAVQLLAIAVLVLYFVIIHRMAHSPIMQPEDSGPPNSDADDCSEAATP